MHVLVAKRIDQGGAGVHGANLAEREGRVLAPARCAVAEHVDQSGNDRIANLHQAVGSVADDRVLAPDPSVVRVAPLALVRRRVGVKSVEQSSGLAVEAQSVAGVDANGFVVRAKIVDARRSGGTATPLTTGTSCPNSQFVRLKPPVVATPGAPEPWRKPCRAPALDLCAERPS